MNYSLNELFTIKEYEKNALVKSEGSKCFELGIIIEGSLKISTLTYNDHEYMITNILKDDFFGENLLFSSQNTYLGDVIANMKTKIAFISKKNLIKLIQTDETFLEYYLTTISNKHLLAYQKIKILSQKSIRDKIMFYLKNNHINSITNKTILAEFLNIPRPSLMRELTKLKKEKIIEINKNKITIL